MEGKTEMITTPIMPNVFSDLVKRGEHKATFTTEKSAWKYHRKISKLLTFSDVKVKCPTEEYADAWEPVTLKPIKNLFYSVKVTNK